MRQHINEVEIEGLVQELKIEERKKDGKKYIAGDIIVRVEQTVGNKREIEEIPVNMWAGEKTKDGRDNRTYASLKKLLETGVSIAATGDPLNADKISITGGSLSVNSFVPQGSNELIQTQRIRGSFINKVNGNFTPKARFHSEIFIKDILDEIVNDEPTGRLLIKGIIVQYGEVADIITYVVENPNAIDFIKNNWQIQDTVEVYGAIRFTVKETVSEQTNVDLGFGEPEEKVVAHKVKEYVIDKGSAEPLEVERCNTEDEIVAALVKRSEQDKAKLNPAPKRTIRGF